jgi:cytochrome c biogenesis protein CcdA
MIRPSTATSRRRVILAIAISSLVLATAGVAGLASSTTGGPPVLFVERISSAINNLGLHAGSVWWIYAFVLGAIAAFNPCGFALLPAYVGFFLNDGAPGHGAARIRRSIVVAATVGLAFTALFGVVAAVFSLGASVIVRSIPWVGLGTGALLVVAGGVVLAGRPLVSGLPQRFATRIGKGSSEPGVRGYAAFGLAYGAASLGCTLPFFLALVGTAVAAGGPGAALAALALYGAGMAAVLIIVTLVAGLTIGVFTRVRVVGRILPGLSALLLLVSGAFVVYYWLTAGRLLLA